MQSRWNPPGAARRRGFTLVELILVMAMLLIVLSVAAPSLSRFFRGRSLDSEARRLVALTRYGQSRAVSEGVPMVLWIDAEAGTYGLESESSYVSEDTKATEYELAKDLELEVELPLTDQGSVPWKITTQIAGTLPAIRFTPDGYIGDNSPERILIRQVHEGDDGVVWIGQSRNRRYYEVQTNVLETARR